MDPNEVQIITEAAMRAVMYGRGPMDVDQNLGPSSETAEASENETLHKLVCTYENVRIPSRRRIDF